MTTQTTVFCTSRFIGHHHWPEAPDEVAYLRVMHRHEFHVRVEAVVTHGDRDVEFHILKRRLEGLLDTWRSANREARLGRSSCEMIAASLGRALRATGDLAVTAVECSEDGENGARVEFS